MAGFRPCFIQDCELAERVSQLPNHIILHYGLVLWTLLLGTIDTLAAPIVSMVEMPSSADSRAQFSKMQSPAQKSLYYQGFRASPL